MWEKLKWVVFAAVVLALLGFVVGFADSIKGLFGQTANEREVERLEGIIATRDSVIDAQDSTLVVLADSAEVLAEDVEETRIREQANARRARHQRDSAFALLLAGGADTALVDMAEAACQSETNACRLMNESLQRQAALFPSRVLAFETQIDTLKAQVASTDSLATALDQPDFKILGIGFDAGPQIGCGAGITTRGFDGMCGFFFGIWPHKKKRDN